LRRTRPLLTITLTLTLLGGACLAGTNWPQFRGPTQEGHSDATNVPLHWSETQGVRWKTPIPGEGWSSPVVWDKQVWMTTATEDGHSLRAVCVDADTVSIVHKVEVFRHEKLDPKNNFNSYASPTPVVEAGRVYVSFGTYGNACLDATTGKPIWKNEELKLDHKEGPGSSPILYKNLFILHCDGTDVQYVVALDKNTGKVAWKTDRTTDFGNKPGDLRKAYNVPLVFNDGRRDLMVSVGAYRVFCYDPNDGREVWSCHIPGFSVVPRPVYRDGVVYVCTGYGTPELWAIRTDGTGDVTNTHVLWKSKQGVPAKPSILMVGDALYFAADTGVARCVDAKTGKTLWQERLEGKYTASPVYAGGNLYFFSEQGQTTVIKPNREKAEIVTENHLDGRFMASPAVVDGGMFLRTEKGLYRVGP
jgi:outer membrane protein assembly factor BamB